MNFYCRKCGWKASSQLAVISGSGQPCHRCGGEMYSCKAVMEGRGNLTTAQMNELLKLQECDECEYRFKCFFL